MLLLIICLTFVNYTESLKKENDEIRKDTQVQPPSQFSDLELRKRGGLGPQGKDGATPQQTDTEMTPVPPKGTSGSALVTPHGGGGTTRRVEVTRHRVNLTLM